MARSERQLASGLRVGLICRDAPLTSDLVGACRRLGYEVADLGNVDALASSSAIASIDAIVFDGCLVDAHSRPRLERFLEREGAAPLVLMAQPGDSARLFEWLERGALDVMSRPPHPLELRVRLARAVATRDVSVHLATLEEELAERSRKSFAERSMIARSAAMITLSDTLTRVAPTRSTILITGESGVGKELVARSVHFLSPRRKEPFIALNCAALPPHLIESELFGHERGAFTGAVSRRAGKFELADGGTLFLDEIGEMDLSTQAKLLRVLEHQEFMRVGGTRPIRVDVRLVAATNADMEALVDQGLFRGDLLYRLKVVSLHVPPLRERREDIPELVDEILTRVCRDNHLAPRTMSESSLALLQDYEWPGNVRELQNTIEAIVVSSASRRLDVEHLPAGIRGLQASSRTPSPLAGRALSEIEREAIRETLLSCNGSRTEAAARLGISVRTLRRRIKELSLDELVPAKPGRPPKSR